MGKKLTVKQIIEHLRGTKEIDREFISEIGVRSEIRNARNEGHLTIKALSRAIRDAIKDKEELKALLKELQNYVRE